MALALGERRLKWDCLTLAGNNALTWLPLAQSHTSPLSHQFLTYLGQFWSFFNKGLRNQKENFSPQYLRGISAHIHSLFKRLNLIWKSEMQKSILTAQMHSWPLKNQHQTAMRLICFGKHNKAHKTQVVLILLSILIQEAFLPVFIAH